MAKMGTNGGIEGLWERYQKFRSVEDRNSLMNNYRSIVELNASLMCGKLPQSEDIADLTQDGGIWV